mmetsp:Transcript_74964/g.165560  ORF Transcript_74964/g.165560 Transcript_74964/m.165560 type:complete len:325 (+) Transcript_74964:248-1222(+)
MRDHDTPSGVLRHCCSLNCLCDGSNLIHLQQQCVAGTNLQGLLDACWVCHQQVIPHDLNTLTHLAHEVLVSIPVVLVEGILDGNEGVLVQPCLVIICQLWSSLLHLCWAAWILEVQVVMLLLRSVELGSCNICANLHLVAVARLGDCFHKNIQGLIVVLHVWCKATLIANVACILAILFLDDTLQVVVHLCANNHRLLETRCTHREDHELLAGQAVSSVASTIDDVEGWYGHHELIGGLSGNLGNVLVEWHAVCCSTSPADCHRHGQNGIRTDFGFAPAPLILGTVDLFNHEFINLGLICHIQAHQLRCEDVVHVGYSFQNTFA